MPSIAQQDYIVIAPKQGRSFANDAAALGELKKAVLNGIAFDCLLKNRLTDEDTLDRVLAVYCNGSDVLASNIGNGEVDDMSLPYTVTQYQGLAAVQEAEDMVLQSPVLAMPEINAITGNILSEVKEGMYICVDGKYLLAGKVGGKLASLTIAETGPGEDTPFVNITWEDAQKLIGLPIA